jgi:phosphoribosyl 1,2-cyclic phosphodiesterase
MKICSLASGSSGNCIYIGNEDSHILIDIGISGKKMKEGLENIGINPSQIQGILITHEHSDHIKGIGVIARKYKIPIYTKAKTFFEIIQKSSIGMIDQELFIQIQEDVPFQIGSIRILPFKSSHDAVDPVCFTFSHGMKKISVATDLGTYDDYIKSHLAESNVLFIEANHDVRMLEVGPYPFFLKQRILSDLGHLSNDLSAQLICELYHENMSHVILGHLSHENNMPEVAYESIKLEISQLLKLKEEDLRVIIANRFTNSELVII